MKIERKKKIHQCEFFDKTIIVKCRKSLKVSFDNNNNEMTALIVVIGLNPSKADDFSSDHTLTILKNYFQKRCGEMVLYNLFQNYSTDTHGIIEETATDFTDQGIQKRLQEADEIVIAWGDETEYTDVKKMAIQQLIKYKSKLRMFQNPKTGKSPCHPRNGLNTLSYIEYSSGLMGVSYASPKEYKGGNI